MESWIIYAMLSAFFGGLTSFLMKVGAERRYNSVELSLYFSAVAAVIAFVVLLFDGRTIDDLSLLLLCGVILGVSYYFTLLTRIQALHHIDTTIYFPIYKTLSPILVTIVSLLYFGESLDLYEKVGIFLGIIIPLLLISKQENMIQRNLKKGLILVLVGVVLVTISFIPGKVIADANLNYSFYLCIAFTTQTIIAALCLFFTKKSPDTVWHSRKEIMQFGAIIGVMMCTALMFLGKALVGNMAIVYTIDAFSIVIAILLAVLIYDEEMNVKKAMVILLSIISMIFFIL